jgi:hypothetical protein
MSQSYSVGAIVPASTFMYGSILIEVTFMPIVLRSRPVEEAVDLSAHSDLYAGHMHTNDARPDA